MIILKESCWRMKKNKKKKKKNNKGFGAYEFLTVAVVCLVLTAILLVAILKLSNKEKYQVFNFNARVMAMNAINYNFSPITMKEDNKNKINRRDFFKLAGAGTPDGAGHCDEQQHPPHHDLAFIFVHLVLLLRARPHRCRS